MANNLVRQLALVSEAEEIDIAEVARVSAALQRQVTRDFSEIWNVSATVDAFVKLEDVPIGYWPMIVRDDIGENAAGFHTDKNNQPFALISTEGEWSLTASHECLEMLADPFGNRLMSGDSPMEDQGRVEFLVEVCDPCESTDFAYTVNGILVSDFYTPRYFDPIESSGVQYSFTGAIERPRQVLRGGYLSWHDPVSDEWWQETWFGGDESEFHRLGKIDGNCGNGSVRAQIDRKTEAAARAARNIRAASKTRAASANRPVTGAEMRHSTVARANALRMQISSILRKASGEGEGGKGYKRRPVPGPRKKP